MAGSYYFVIVGRHDNPIYEKNFEAKNTQKTNEIPKEGNRHLNQFIGHASLDLEATYRNQNNSGQMYLKVIDKFNEWFVSSFTTASSIRFIILHDTTNEEGIKLFFQNVNELYIKHLMNPMYVLNDSITSPIFDQKISLYSIKYLIN